MSDRDLPTAERDEGAAGPPEEARPDQPPAHRLVGTLGTAAALAGLAIVFVFQWAQPKIEAHRARELRVAIQEVLGGPEHYEKRWVADGELHETLPAGVDSTDAAVVYVGYDASDRLVGYAIPGERPGYQDVIRLIFGYDPAGDRVMGMKVLESKETPGLGAKITNDSSFIGEFEGIEPPLEGVKEGGDGPHEVDMITGATISSEAVIEIINGRLETLGAALGPAGGGRTTEAAAGEADGGPEGVGGEGGTR